MYYTIEENSTYSSGDEVYRRNEIPIKDCTDEELNEIRKVVSRLYDAYVKRRELEPE